MLKLSLIAAAISTLAFAGTPARADNDLTVTTASPNTRFVSYAASDLASDRSVIQLKRRVHMAAREVCGPQPNAYTDAFGELRCFQVAFDDAMGQVDRAVARHRQGQVVAMGAAVVLRAR